MCMRSLWSPATPKWPGEHIYIGLKLELAVWSRWTLFCVGVGTFGTTASVLPVTLSSEVAVGFSDMGAATSGTNG